MPIAAPGGVISFVGNGIGRNYRHYFDLQGSPTPANAITHKDKTEHG